MIDRTSASRDRRGLRLTLGIVALVFGAATLREGGRVLFGGPEVRAAAGHVVPFVLTFNFGAGFVYLAAGVATLARRRSAAWLARALAASTLVVFAALGLHILLGGAYERRTVLAMAFRSALWCVEAWLVPRALGGPVDARHPEGTA